MEGLKGIVMTNVAKKNSSIVMSELRAWRDEMAEGFYRLKGASLHFNETNVFHILTGLLTETYRKLPRTLTYLTIIGLALWFGMEIVL